MKRILLVLPLIIGCKTYQPSPPIDSGEVRSDLLELHNFHRETPLILNKKLNIAAQKHANWMASNNKLSHSGENYSQVWDRVKNEEYNFQVIGENVGYGYSTSHAIVDGWMDSSGHRKNILNGEFNEVGFGVAVDDKGKKYWCAVYGKKWELTSSDIKPVTEIKYSKQASRDGWEERGKEYIYWLAPSIRIRSNGSMGSGTIIYYDEKTNWAYVISCGHLFNDGSMSTEEGKRKNKTVKIDVYYKNKKKLNKYESFEAEVLCYQNFETSVWDVSLLRFKPNWKIDWWIPIADKNIEIKKGDQLYSTGSDGGSECALYIIEYLSEEQRGSVTEFVTHKNNPRGGRSGGGTSKNKQLVAICSRGGGGKAYWTSLQQIYKLLEQEKEYTWLLTLPRMNYIINKIPIIDRANPNFKPDRNDYISVP